MKKIAISLIVLTFALIAKPTDVYFANGILTSEVQAKENADLLWKRINRPDVPTVHVAYNHTFDSHFVKGGPDLFESLLQKLSVMNKIDKWLSNDKRVTAHKFDLDKQVAQYQHSIESGHKVLVVAHSQGNLFANEAYGRIDEMGYGDALDALSIASPMFGSIKSDTVTFSWDNDLVADLALNPLRKRYKCAVRKVEWLKSVYYPKTVMPAVNYIYASDKKRLLHHEWKPKEPLINFFDSNVHAFTFYMGEALKDSETNIEFVEPFNHLKLIDTQLKTKILSKIDQILDANAAIDEGGGDNGTDPGSGGGSGTNPIDPSSFDYQAACSSYGIDFPEPIPPILKTTINTILTNTASNFVPDVACNAIKSAVEAYNLSNKLPSGGGTPSIP